MELRDENGELKETLSDYQRVLDIVMTRTRDQTVRWVETLTTQDEKIKRLTEERDAAVVCRHDGVVM